MAKHHAIDYETFLPRLVAGLRKAWQEVRRLRRDETFYTLGVETDSDITDLYPLCNTEQEYVVQGGDSEPSIDKWISCLNEDSELYRAGNKHTDALAQEVNRYVFEDHSKDPKGAFAERKKRLLKIFEQALVQLDKEAFFGSGKQRHKVLLRIEFVDPSDAEWKHMLKVIKRINPPQSTARFFALLEKAEKNRANEELGEQAVIPMATEFLGREKQSFDRCTGAYPVRNEAMFPYLTKLLGLAETPKQMWEVYFEAEGIPEGRGHGANTIVIVIDPETGNCASEP